MSVYTQMQPQGETNSSKNKAAASQPMLRVTCKPCSRNIEVDRTETMATSITHLLLLQGLRSLHCTCGKAQRNVTRGRSQGGQGAHLDGAASPGAWAGGPAGGLS